MCDCHKKKTFKEFSVRDAGYDFRCKECGWMVEIRGWMRFLLNFSSYMGAYFLFDWFKQQGGIFGLGKYRGLIFEIPIALALGYVYVRVTGYWMYSLAWKLAERDCS